MDTLAARRDGLRDSKAGPPSSPQHEQLGIVPVFISNAPEPNMPKSLLLTALLLFTLNASAADLTRVMDEAQKPSNLETNLRTLTDEIGGRVPGTPAMQRAIDWGVAAFKQADADKVYTEKFEIPVAWAEGDTRIAVVDPVQFPVRAVSVAWAPALPVKRHVRVVDVGDGTDDNFKTAGNVAGALLLVHSKVLQTWDDLFDEYLRADGIITRAVRAQAAAIAFTSTREHDILYRHINTQDGRIDRIPQLVVAREDAERMARLLASGKSLFADVSIPNRVGRAITTANVIAELRGSERPDEYVVLGAHLDSWELGTGALDNGCDAALVVDTLRAIRASGIQPRRSIRFILFSGEEQGLLGSRAYVATHKNEMDNVAGVVIFDSGTGHVSGFSTGGRKDIVASVSKLIEPLKTFQATELTNNADTGTDNFDFLLEGVPTLVANNDTANYLVNYHATSDTFDKVDQLQLKRQVAEAAEVTLAIANDPGRIGPRQTRAQIEQLMKETKLDEQMKQQGMWSDWESGRRGRSK